MGADVLRQVIADAKGLAIFTAMREGLWISGAGGSGILVARRADGTWSPPAGIMLHVPYLGFSIGVDLYDCVLVINDQDGLNAFLSPRCTLGVDIDVMAGPIVAGDAAEPDGQVAPMPVWSYLKSHGFYAGVPMDGTVVTGRADENERFYGEKISVPDILAGRARRPPREIKTLVETIRAAQGEGDVDERLLPPEAAPGDMRFEKPGRVFGIPDGDDPDPYGVRALEMEGLDIREAGTKSRASSEQFEYRPSPTSPIYFTFLHRRSTSSLSGKPRESNSRRSIDRGTQMIESGTQTVDEPSSTNRPEADHARAQSWPVYDGGNEMTTGYDMPSSRDEGYERVDETIPEEHEETSGAHKGLDPHDPDDGPVEIHEEVRAQAVYKARLVTIPRRMPPALPPRSAARKKIVVNGDTRPTGSVWLPTSDAATTNPMVASPEEEKTEEPHDWSEAFLRRPSRSPSPTSEAVDGRVASSDSRAP